MAAVGGTAEVMAHVANGDYEMVGTFNGNPLAMAAARAMLREVATPRPTSGWRSCGCWPSRGWSGRSPGTGCAPTSSRSAPRAAWCSRPSRSAISAASCGIEDAYSHAHWLFQHNGGVFLPPWGKIEQWLISVQHDEADIERFVS